MKKRTKIILGIGCLLVGIQLIPLDRNNPPVENKKNFVMVENTPQNIQKLLQKACYDCHSYEVKYPWYSYIAPFSWSIKHHINEGREHLNFSEWGSYNNDIKRKAMQESAEEIISNKMPLSGYLPLHPEARLSTEEKQALIHYFQEVSRRIP